MKIEFNNYFKYLEFMNSLPESIIYSTIYSVTKIPKTLEMISFTKLGTVYANYQVKDQDVTELLVGAEFLSPIETENFVIRNDGTVKVF